MMPRTKGSIFFTLVFLDNNVIRTKEVRGDEELAKAITDATEAGVSVTVIKGRLYSNVSGLKAVVGA